MELALNTNVIKKSGAMYTFRQNDELIFKAAGKEGLRETLNDNEKAFEKLQSSLIFKQDESTKLQYQDEKDELPDEMDDLLSNVAENFIEKQEKKKGKKEESDGD